MPLFKLLSSCLGWRKSPASDRPSPQLNACPSPKRTTDCLLMRYESNLSSNGSRTLVEQTDEPKISERQLAEVPRRPPPIMIQDAPPDPERVQTPPSKKHNWPAPLHLPPEGPLPMPPAASTVAQNRYVKVTISRKNNSALWNNIIIHGLSQNGIPYLVNIGYTLYDIFIHPDKVAVFNKEYGHLEKDPFDRDGDLVRIRGMHGAIHEVISRYKTELYNVTSSLSKSLLQAQLSEYKELEKGMIGGKSRFLAPAHHPATQPQLAAGKSFHLNTYAL